MEGEITAPHKEFPMFVVFLLLACTTPAPTYTTWDCIGSDAPDPAHTLWTCAKTEEEARDALGGDLCVTTDGTLLAGRPVWRSIPGCTITCKPEKDAGTCTPG